MFRVVIAVLSAVAACAWPANARAGIILGENLLGNPGAELGPGGTGQVVPIPGWSVTQGLLTVAQYGAAPNLLTTSQPGPPSPGDHYFTGGTAEISVAEQRYNLFPFATGIDAGDFSVELSGWLGSAVPDPDFAELSVAFLDAAQGEIARFGIGPAAFRGAQSGLVFYEDGFAIPAGAREAVVELTLVRIAGSYNDAAADELSFMIVPSPGPAALFALAGAAAMKRRRL